LDKANQLKSTVKKAGQLAKSTKPNVDKVTPFEVYLLDDKNKRTKRICGTQRNDMPEGYVCLKPAGDGTDHPGYGQCTYHDRQITNPNNTGLWENLNREAGLPANLMEYFQNAEIIEEKHLTSVDEDIKGMYALVTYVMQRRRDTENPEEGFLTNQDIDLVMKITDKIIKAKELRPKLKKEVSLDTTTVKAFVDQIFKIIMQNAAKNVGKRILTEIMDEVIVPFKTQGRIVGKEFDYKKESEVLEAEVKDE
tara:strand:- start:2412 stop:3164 length:753 start_codon:yes stop_codon:yes gene_type:complete